MADNLILNTAGFAGKNTGSLEGVITTVGPVGGGPDDTFAAKGDFNLSVWSLDAGQPWTGQVQVERSYDFGVNWHRYLDANQSAEAGYSLQGPFSISMVEPGRNVLYRVNAKTLNGPNDPANSGARYRFTR